MFRRLGHWASIWRAAAREEKERPRIKRKGDELEFLPAALEVLETPVSPLPRVIIALIVLFFAGAITWAILGRIDTVAVATGRIIPSGQVKVIQVPEQGTVTAIHVRDGRPVKKGDPLLTFDPTEARADRDRLQRELLAARVDVARFTAIVMAAADPLKHFRPPPGVEVKLLAASRRLLQERWREIRSKVRAIDADIAKQAANRSVILAQAAKLEATLPLLRRRVEAREKLAARRHGTTSAFLELKQELVEMEGDLKIARRQADEGAQSIAALRRRREETIAADRAAANDELAKALRNVSSLEQQLAKAAIRFKMKRLYAPVAGVVQQLQIHTIGAVAKPADPLMVIVPHGATLEIEAQVLNKDIGFVRQGQEARIKVDAFPFTKYGLIQGRVVNLSADAIQDKERGLVYAARVSLRQKRILVGDRWVALAPGMSVTVEVKTGQRRVIDFFLSPLMEYQDEALRER